MVQFQGMKQHNLKVITSKSMQSRYVCRRCHVLAHWILQSADDAVFILFVYFHFNQFQSVHFYQLHKIVEFTVFGSGILYFTIRIFVDSA